MKKKDKVKTGRSKVVVMIAWVLLLVFMISFVGIIYLKFLVGKEGSNNQISENKMPEENKAEDDLSELWSLMENFNNSSLRKSYLEQGVGMSASVLDNGITVMYQVDNRNKNYHFTYNNKGLEIKVNQGDEEEFYDVFRIMVHAVQGLLGNDRQVLDTYVKDFFYQDKEFKGLKKESASASIRYFIDTTVVLEDSTTRESGGDELEDNQDVSAISG